MTRLPPSTLWFGIIRTTAIAWLLCRLALFFAEVFTPSPVTGVAIVLIAAVVGPLDLRIAREEVFVDNLGVSRISRFAVALPASAFLETIAQVLV